MTSPAVSIGLPIYNGASLMRRAIDSVLVQDFTDFELVISDNASTDDTGAIAAEYASADARIRYIRHAENVGPLSNFQYVLSVARGEMFSWIAHDDFYHRPDHVRLLAEKIREGSALAFPSVHVVRLYADGSTVREERDMLAGFAKIRTKRQLVREAIRRSSVQIYGMFRTATLRDYLHLLLEDGDMSCYFESRFIQTMLVTEPWSFVPEAQLNSGQSEANYTRQLDPKPMLRDFLRFSKRTAAMYRRNSRFSAGERLMVYYEMLCAYGPHAARLWGSVLKRTLRG